MASTQTIKSAYFPSWLSESFPPSAIDATLFTHICYAFLEPSDDSSKFQLSSEKSALLRNFTSTLHQKNPPVKTLLSIGGANCSTENFTKMASKEKSRKIFIKSAIAVARKYEFDGLDFSWLFPRNPYDMELWDLLLRDWRTAIEEEAGSTNQSPLLLTAAVYFSNRLRFDTERKYPVSCIIENLDWVNVACYDYHGSWDTSATGAHAALYDANSTISTKDGLMSWINAGVPPQKVVMGLPLYGRTWQLIDPNIHGIGAHAVAVGPGNDGVLFYHQVERFNRESGATVVYDEKTVSTYSYAGTSWIGYDDIKSITTKIEFARSIGLRGYFLWALSYDSEWKISKQASSAWTSQ